jgi:diacylglycerol kinase family enzyme
MLPNLAVYAQTNPGQPLVQRLTYRVNKTLDDRVVVTGLRNLPLFRLTILVEGTVEPCRSPCVLVGNNEYRISGPGLGTRERLDRGELCLYVAKTQGRLSMFWLACRCILGLVKQQRDLRIFKGATADISARRSRLLVAFDGEVATMRSPLHFKI